MRALLLLLTGLFAILAINEIVRFNRIASSCSLGVKEANRLLLGSEKRVTPCQLRVLRAAGRAYATAGTSAAFILASLFVVASEQRARLIHKLWLERNSPSG